MFNFENAKSLANSLFDFFEVTTVNYAVRRLHRWKIRKKYLKNTDYLSSSDKKETIVYWRKYTSSFKTYWHKFYSSCTGVFDVRYIPDDLYYTKIDQHFNNRRYGWGVNDKNYYSLWFPDSKQPVTIIRKINGIYYNKDYKIIDQSIALEYCLKNIGLVIKPAVETGRSRGIVFWNNSEGRQVLINILNQTGDNIIVQKLIEQHSDLHKIHPDSVNTIRIISLIFKNNVVILSSILRMGVNKSKVDNASAGGITCGITVDGRLKRHGYYMNGIKSERHPQGFVFDGFVVPSYDKIKAIILNEHEKMAHFRLISWDIAVGHDGEPILVEANLRNGGLRSHQLNNGPLFGSLTDEILQEVFRKKNRNRFVSK